MSTILKALRRLEEQKSRSTERPLRDEVVLTPTRRARSGGVARAAVAGVVLALAAAALVFALRPAPEPEPAAPAVASAPELPAVAAPPPAETRVTVAAGGGTTPNAVVPVPEKPADFEVVRPDASLPTRMLAPRPLPTIAGDEILAEIPSTTGPRVLSPPMPDEYFEEPLEEMAPEPRATARASAPVRVARTLWHPSPERRLAWVEVEGQTALREVREGESVGPYVVREIEPAAVLFTEGGVAVRREVGP